MDFDFEKKFREIDLPYKSILLFFIMDPFKRLWFSALFYRLGLGVGLISRFNTCDINIAPD